jgi:hypothetical protein
MVIAKIKCRKRKNLFEIEILQERIFVAIFMIIPQNKAIP